MNERRSADWRVERSTDGAAALLGPWPAREEDEEPVVRVGRVSGRPALVLGSTQNPQAVDEIAAARAGVDVIRRSTGGGAVLVAPEAQVWLDVWVPRAHPLWDDDIVNAAVWLGDAWVVALTRLGARSLVVHEGRSTRDAVSDLVCFAGLGPGEVSVDATSRRRKVMGLAQRRTRRGARFHTTAPLGWDPDLLVDLLHLAIPDDRRVPWKDLAVGLRDVLCSRSALNDVEMIGTVEDAVIAALP